MIKANELRIGNWVESIKWDCYSQIDSAKDIDLAVELKATPISLTEEWLNKLGLSVGREFVAWGRKSNIMHVDITGDLYLAQHDGKWQLSLCREDEAYPTNLELNEIKYVHQLQNLYFALTGEELELKP